MRTHLIGITFTFGGTPHVVTVRFTPCKNPGWRWNYECNFLVMPGPTEKGTFNGAANRTNAMRIINSFLIDVKNKPLGL